MKSVLFGYTRGLNSREKFILEEIFETDDVEKDEIFYITDTCYIEVSITGDYLFRIEVYRANRELLEDLLGIVSIVNNHFPKVCTELVIEEENIFSLYLSYPVSKINYRKDLIGIRKSLFNIGKVLERGIVDESSIQNSNSGSVVFDMQGLEDSINSILKSDNDQKKEGEE